VKRRIALAWTGIALAQSSLPALAQSSADVARWVKVIRDENITVAN
jgi:hypothetical protein